MRKENKLPVPESVLEIRCDVFKIAENQSANHYWIHKLHDTPLMPLYFAHWLYSEVQAGNIVLKIK